MKRETADQRLTQEADEQLDRLVDAALRVSAQPPATVKARVMEAWDQRHAAGGRLPALGTPWKPLTPVLRPVAALAGALVIVLGVFLAWQHVSREFDAVDRPQLSQEARTQPPPPRPAAPAEHRADASSATPAGGEAIVTASARPRRSRYITVAWPVEQVAEAGPQLPGAPAGELGDPVAPMGRPAPITIAPIEAAPSISEIARPVTEFPADTQPPAGGQGADAGKSGGPRR